MKVLIAADKFKGSLTANEVCHSIMQGVLKVDPTADCERLPLADGGEGTLDILLDVLDLQHVEVTVQDPLFRPIVSGYGIREGVAYIEMARASGYELLTDAERSATQTSSIGTGELMRDALEKGARKIFLFVGGSATNDGGMGMAAALGIRFLDQEGNEVVPIGANLSVINSVDLDGFVFGADVVLVTDVSNPLLGPDGASHQYGPQKGATQEEVLMLDQGMAHLAGRVENQVGKDISEVPGSGAAGGLGLSVLGLLNGSVQNGIQTLLKQVKFADKVKEADLVITGEGKIDEQTLQGKVVYGVTKAAQEVNLPVVAICGDSRLNDAQESQLGLERVLRLMQDDLSVDYCINHAAELIQARISEFLGTRETP